MVRIESEKTIIEVENYEEMEHDFVQDLQLDLIQLMNCIYILRNEHNVFIPSSFLSIMQLQKALVTTTEELKIIHPISSPSISLDS